MTEDDRFEQARRLAGREQTAFLNRECPDLVMRARVEALTQLAATCSLRHR